jgi:hypothetical protein
MAIPKETVVKMNDLLKKGSTISNLAKKFPKYSYWEIYWSVDDYSILGKKRSISNRLKKLENSRMPKSERTKLVKEIKENLNGIYSITKKNGKKLIDIGRIMEK